MNPISEKEDDSNFDFDNHYRRSRRNAICDDTLEVHVLHQLNRLRLEEDRRIMENEAGGHREGELHTGSRKLLSGILEKCREGVKNETVRTELRKRKRPIEDVDGDDNDVLMELDFINSDASSLDDIPFTQRSHAIAESISDGEKKLKSFMNLDFDGFKQLLLADCHHRNRVKSYLTIIIKGTTKLAKRSQQKCADRGKIIMRVLLDLALEKSKVPEDVTKDLTKIGGDCIKYFPTSVAYDIVMKVGFDFISGNLKTGKLPESWINLYRQCMIKLFQGGNIEHDGDSISGKEIRLIFVNQMCRLNWNSTLGPTIVKILMELPTLYDDIAEELDTIVSACEFKCTEGIDQKHLYDIVQYLIEGIGKCRARALIKICDGFFKKDDYYQTPERTVAGNLAAKERFLGRIAYLFVDAARHCDAIQVEFNKIVKAATFDHSLIMSPFMTTVLMGLAGIDHLSAGIVEPVKISILRYTLDWNLGEESQFYAESAKLMTGFSRQPLMHPSGWTYLMKAKLDLVHDGLEKLGMALLGVDSLQKKYPGTGSVVKQLGVNLLISVVVKEKESLANMLKCLLRTDSPAHIECLARCLADCSRILSQQSFQGRIGEVIHHLPATNVSTASMIVKALMPAIQLSQVLLDELMIVLRKTFWKSVESGRICVEIMCVLMSSSKVVGSNDALSRPASSEDDDLLLTQGSQTLPLRSDVDFSPICGEMLNLTKRCLELDSQVREQVYLGLHRVARRNPGLCDLICGHLFSHASQYRYDQSTISFKSLFELSATNMDEVKVKDELGFLVQCIGFVFNKYEGLEQPNLDKPVSFINCKSLLEEWIEFTITINPERIEIIASSLLEAAGNGRPPDIARYVRDVILMQIMQMNEALIEFVALSHKWPSAKRKILQLFKNLTKLQAYAMEQASQKKIKQPGKKNPKKTKAKSDEMEADDDVSVASGSDNLNQTSTKIKSNPAPKLEYFHLMNLDSVCQMLRDLYKKESATSVLRDVKGCCEFEMLLLNTIRMKLIKLKAKISIRERERCPDDVLNALTCLVEVIWNRLLENTQQFKENEAVSEDVVVIEMRLEILMLVLQHFHETRLRDRIKYFEDHRVKPTTDNTVADSEHFKTFENWKSVLHMVETQFDGANEHGCTDLFALLNVWCKNVHSAAVQEKILSWVWEYLNNDSDKTGTEELLVSVVELFTSSYIKYFIFPEPRIAPRKGVIVDPQPDENCPFQFGIYKIAKAVHIVLGDSDNERVTQRKRSWLITKECSPKLYCTLTSFIGRQLELVSMTLGCMKSHHQYVGEETWSEKMRESCIQMIYYLRFIANELICTSFPAGPCGTEILKLCTQFYNVMTFFTEYYIEVTGHHNEISMKHFKQLLGDFGREFKPKVESMIQHVELVQRERCEEAPGKAKLAKSQIAKDGRLIPNLVFHIEKFEQKLIALSKKVKTAYEIDLLTEMKLSTSRDFCIKSAELMIALKEKAEPKKKSRQKKTAVTADVNAVEVMEVDQDS